MIGFPGRVFDGEGKAVDGLANDLTQERLDACLGKNMVTHQELAPVVWVWLLNPGTGWSDIPADVEDDVVKLILGGKSLLILSERPEPSADVRDGLLEKLEQEGAAIDLARLVGP